jgi:Holliday junction resolvase RusA-like endonuclease
MQTISFTVLGEPRPAGSKRAMPIYRKGAKGKQLVTRADGSPLIAVTDDNAKSKGWKQEVAQAARHMYDGDLLDGPLKLTLRFFRIRPKGHFGKSGLNGAGRGSMAPTTKPDVLKLARAVEDALTGVIWRDDAQIVVESLSKWWGEPARVEISIDVLG